MKYTAIIIDDEPLARNLVFNLLDEINSIKVLGQYGTGVDALQGITMLQPDMVFIDIQLKDMTGFEVLEQVKGKLPLIIFITAYDHYAIEAFDIFAFDYVLKPFTEERFYKSVQKSIEILERQNNDEYERKWLELKNHLSSKSNKNDKIKDRIPVPLGNKTVFVYTKDISYIKASNYYIEIFTSESRFVLRASMYHILSELDPDIFIRIHRSSIVNLKCVEELINSGFGEIDVKIKGGPRLRVSKGYRKDFLVKMGIKK